MSVILKWYKGWLRVLNHVIARAGSTLREPLAIWRFLQRRSA